MMPNIVCSAVRPDTSIVSVHHETYTKEIFEKISLYCQYHLGCPAKYFIISNITSSMQMDSSKLD